MTLAPCPGNTICPVSTPSGHVEYCDPYSLCLVVRLAGEEAPVRSRLLYGEGRVNRLHLTSTRSRRRIGPCARSDVYLPSAPPVATVPTILSSFRVSTAEPQSNAANPEPPTASDVFERMLVDGCDVEFPEQFDLLVEFTSADAARDALGIRQMLRHVAYDGFGDCTWYREAVDGAAGLMVHFDEDTRHSISSDGMYSRRTAVRMSVRDPEAFRHLLSSRVPCADGAHCHVVFNVSNVVFVTD